MKITRRQLIQIIKEALADRQQLVDLNKKVLMQTIDRPEKGVNAREYYQEKNKEMAEKAAEGEGVYNAETLKAVEAIPDEELKDMEKRQLFVRWLAIQIIDGKSYTQIKEAMPGVKEFFDATQDISDKIKPEALMAKYKAFVEAGGIPFKEAQEDEEIIWDETTSHLKGTGYTIRKLYPKALGPEGEKMGHCVGSYCEAVSAGTKVIYSLRDKENEPHVTIEIGELDQDQITSWYDYHGDEDPPKEVLIQVKGKENAPPVQKYGKLVQPFIKKYFRLANGKTNWYAIMGVPVDEDIYEEEEKDYLDIASSEDIKELFKHEDYRDILKYRINDPGIIKEFIDALVLADKRKMSVYSAGHDMLRMLNENPYFSEEMYVYIIDQILDSKNGIVKLGERPDGSWSTALIKATIKLPAEKQIESISKLEDAGVSILIKDVAQNTSSSETLKYLTRKDKDGMYAFTDPVIGKAVRNKRVDDEELMNDLFDDLKDSNSLTVLTGMMTNPSISIDIVKYILTEYDWESFNKDRGSTKDHRIYTYEYAAGHPQLTPELFNLMAQTWGVHMRYLVRNPIISDPSVRDSVLHIVKRPRTKSGETDTNQTGNWANAIDILAASRKMTPELAADIIEEVTGLTFDEGKNEVKRVLTDLDKAQTLELQVLERLMGAFPRFALENPTVVKLAEKTVEALQDITWIGLETEASGYKWLPKIYAAASKLIKFVELVKNEPLMEGNKMRITKRQLREMVRRTIKENVDLTKAYERSPESQEIMTTLQGNEVFRKLALNLLTQTKGQDVPTAIQTVSSSLANLLAELAPSESWIKAYVNWSDKGNTPFANWELFQTEEGLMSMFGHFAIEPRAAFFIKDVEASSEYDEDFAYEQEESEEALLLNRVREGQADSLTDAEREKLMAYLGDLMEDPGEDQDELMDLYSLVAQ